MELEIYEETSEKLDMAGSLRKAFGFFDPLNESTHLRCRDRLSLLAKGHSATRCFWWVQQWFFWWISNGESWLIIVMMVMVNQINVGKMWVLPSITKSELIVN
jgi:hypothetical protein